MAFKNCTTFNTRKDNGNAAAEFLRRIKAAGFDGELVEVSRDAQADALERGAPSAPAAVSHNAPAEQSVPISVDVETEHDGADDDGLERSARALRPERFRSESSSPTRPFGRPPTE